MVKSNIPNDATQTDSSAQDTIEHLKMVQGVIARMANNSVQMKTWAVSLVTAVVVFSGLSDNPHWLLGTGGCISVVFLGIMDAKYLHLERCYVKLHEAVVAKKSRSFDLNYRPYADKVGFFGWTIYIFYGSLLAIMIALLFILTRSPKT